MRTTTCGPVPVVLSAGIVFLHAATAVLARTSEPFAATVTPAASRQTSPTSIAPSSTTTASTVIISAVSRRSFESAFTTISQQAEVTIIAESVPFHATLTDEQLSALNKSLPADAPATLADAVTKIASAFDYDAEQTDAHTFLLRKRYSDENDLPCVTYGEVVHALHAVLTITDALAPVKTLRGTPDSLKYYYSLTDEQQKRAKDGLSFADLTPEQRKYAVGAAGWTGLSRETMQLQDVYDHLVALKKPNTVFTWMTTHAGFEAFGYQGNLYPLGNFGPCPLDNHYRLLGGAGYERIVKRTKIVKNITPNDTEIHYVDAPDPGPDPADPTELDRHLAAGMLVDRLPSTKTLAEEAQVIAAAKTTGGDASDNAPLHISVAPELADKPVCLYGSTYSTPDHLIRSLTALYDLELLVPKKGSYDIALPIPRTPRTREEYASEIKRLIPLPLLRQYTGLSATLAAAMPPYQLPPGVISPSPQYLERERRYTLESNRFQGTIDALTAGYYPPVRRLLVLAKPAVPTLDSPPVPVVKANPECLRLIALALYSSACREPVKELTEHPMPIYLFEPSRLVVKLSASHTEDKLHLDYDFGYKDDDGTFHAEAQASMGAAYKPLKQ